MTDLSVAVLPSLGKSDRTKVLEFIGYQETVERSQSGFCRDCLGGEKKMKRRGMKKGNKKKKTLTERLRWSKNLGDSFGFRLLVADLISCDIPSSLHLMFNTLSTERSSTTTGVVMLFHSASKQSAQIENTDPSLRHAPVISNLSHTILILHIARRSVPCA